MSTGASAVFRVVVAGLGIAGRSRIRDLPGCAKGQYPGLEHVQVAGFISSRSLGDIDGIPQISLEDALQDDTINAVIIATENARHAPIARRALEAKKHVLVDYPLAQNATVAKELFDLAEKNDVVCYEEDIGMLTDDYASVKTMVKSKPALTESTTIMKGGLNGWIEDFEASGPPYVSSINLIHKLVDFFGDLEPETSTIHREENAYKAEAVLRTQDGRKVSLVIDRARGVKREASFSYTFADSSVIDQNTPLTATGDFCEMPKGLFMRDFFLFVQTVENKRSNSYNQWLTMRGLEIADKLYALSKI